MKSLELIYFSPTGTTGKIIKAVSRGISSADIKDNNLTYCSPGSLKINGNSIAVIGIPVYAGRVPETFINRFENIKASGIPAVIIAVYGNRLFEDSLLELSNIVKEKGFNVIAAAAFIGEHSYSNSVQPIAAGRPDNEDLDKAAEFGRQILSKLEGGDFSEPEIPGNFPHREGVKSAGIAPVTDEELCVKCGRCEELCPVNAVKVSDTVITNAQDCIMCCACIKNCPSEARSFIHEMINSTRDKLYKNCSVPKIPEIFI